jgi:Rab family, other
MDESDDFDFLYKIIVVGNSSVGKTFLLANYVNKVTPSKLPATVGVEIAVKMAALRNGNIVKAQLWDTAGQERYNAIAKTHYRRAHAALLVYDITSRESYEALGHWMKELKTYGQPDMVIWIVGNKEDLRKGDSAQSGEDVDEIRRAQRTVPAHEGIRFAQKHRLKSRRENGWMHSLTSAKTGYNVSELFNGLYEEIFETFGNTLAKKHAWEPQEKVLFDIPISQPSPRKKCC